jgi:hypothetical protein
MADRQSSGSSGKHNFVLRANKEALMHGKKSTFENMFLELLQMNCNMISQHLNAIRSKM